MILVSFLSKRYIGLRGNKESNILVETKKKYVLQILDHGLRHDISPINLTRQRHKTASCHQLIENICKGTE